MRFAQPEFLWLLWALPLLWAVFWWNRDRARRKTAAFTGEALESRLVLLGRFEDGRIAEVWTLTLDPAALEKFWGIS